MLSFLLFVVIMIGAIFWVNSWVIKKLKWHLGTVTLPDFLNIMSWFASVGIIMTVLSILQLVIKAIIFFL